MLNGLEARKVRLNPYSNGICSKRLVELMYETA